jgi:hypothetical protein
MYSLTPRKKNSVREGKSTRVREDGCRADRPGRGLGERKLKSRVLSPVKEDRQVTIISGEMYPEWEIFQSRRWTRLLVDKSRFGNAGNGMFEKWSDCRSGEDPPKKFSEMAVTGSSLDESSRCVNIGNGSCINPVKISNWEIPRSLRLI